MLRHFCWVIYYLLATVFFHLRYFQLNTRFHKQRFFQLRLSVAQYIKASSYYDTFYIYYICVHDLGLLCRIIIVIYYSYSSSFSL